MTQDICKRNCWIAGAALGLLVLVLSWTGMGLAGALFLAIIAGALFGGLLVWLVCSGDRGSAPDLVASEPSTASGGSAPGGRTLTIDRDEDPGPAETVLMGTAQAPVIPVGQPAPPRSIVAGATRDQTLSHGAVRAATAGGQAPTFGTQGNTAGSSLGHAGQDSSEPAPVAEDSPLEDTRAVMDDPSESQDHRMPGESVRSAEPGGVQDQRPPRGPDMEDLNDPSTVDDATGSSEGGDSGTERATDAGPRP
jgi:hypothetical protein